MITVQMVKDGKQMPSPIYKEMPYIVLNKSGTGPVLSAGTLDHIKELTDYYRECTVQVRKHDLYMNNNDRVQGE